MFLSKYGHQNANHARVKLRSAKGVATMEVNMALFRKNSVFILEVLIIIILHKAWRSKCFNFDFELVTHPTDASVKEGQSATFLCTVRPNDPFTSVSSYWENGLSESVHENHQFTIVTTPGETNQSVTSKLMINEVQREMNAFYKCSIIFRFEDHSHQVFISEFGRLDVLYFLSENELLCEGPSTNVLTEDELCSIKCKGVHTNPPLILKWLSPDPEIVITSKYTENETALVGDVEVRQALHKKSFMCVATSNAFPDEQVNCSVGPFRVMHSPVVEIIPYQSRIIWPLITEISFQCQFSGYPEVQNFSWYCHPEEMISQCFSLSPNLTINILHIRQRSVLNISCEASNNISSSRNYSYVTLEYIDEELIPDCKSNMAYSLHLKENSAPTLEFNSMSGALTCMIEVHTLYSTHFSWYLNGKAIAKEDGNSLFRKSPLGNKSNMVYSMIVLSTPGIVACGFSPHGPNESQLEVTACKMFQNDITEHTTDWLQINHLTIPISEARSTSTKYEPLQYLISQPGRVNDEQNVATEIPDSAPQTSEGIMGVFWTVALAIAVMLGLLLCSIGIVLASQKLMSRGGSLPHQLGPGIEMGMVGNIQHSGQESSVDIRSNNGKPVYEIPDNGASALVTGRSRGFVTSVQSERKCYHRNPANIDSTIEDSESFTESTGSTGSHGSGTYSSSDTVRNSCLYEEANMVEGEIPPTGHYENREVLEFIVGNNGRKYSRAKLAGTRIKEQ